MNKNTSNELFRKTEQLKFEICKSGIQLTHYKRMAEDAAGVIVWQNNTIKRLQRTSKCTKSGTRQTDPRKTYMIRHKEAGLCTRCASPATHGQMCEQHWLKYKEHKRKYRNNIITSRRDKGLCIGCGSPLDAESDAKCKCINCTERRLRPERGKRLHENIVNNRYAR